MQGSLEGVGILGLGSTVPSKLVTNDEVEEMTGLPDGWILEKTGIQGRYVAGEGETASGMSEVAARMALERARVTPKDLDLIIACTFSADYVMPALACKVHQLLGAKEAGAFDIMANCTAFQVGLSVAADRLKSDPSLSHALVVGSAIVSRYIDWSDPKSAIYFGDGVGAAVLGRVPRGYGFLAHEVMTQADAYESVRLRGGSTSRRRIGEESSKLPYIEMNGLDVWKQAAQYQPVVIRRVLQKIGRTAEEVDFFIFHQANMHLLDYIMGKMKLPADRTHMNVDRIGNTAEASMAIALTEAVELGRIKHGDLVVISGVGAGFTFGASVMRWYAP